MTRRADRCAIGPEVYPYDLGTMAALSRGCRRAAEAGDPVGRFDLGLDLLRGRGVVRDDAAGRKLIDPAAAEGLPVALRLQGAGYELDVVTPDADNWKYAPLF